MLYMSSSSNVPFKINNTGLFINPLVDTPDFSAHIQTIENVSIEPYNTMSSSSDNYAKVHVPTEERALSFIPEGHYYNVYDGKIRHPRGVFMDKNGVEYPKVPVDTPIPKKGCLKKQEQHQNDKMLMKYYIAGISVVGVLVLARLLSTSK